MWSNSASMAASTERPSRQSTRSHVKTGGTRHLPRRRRLRAAVRPGEAGVPCPGFLPKPRLHSLQNLCDSSLSSRLQVAHLTMTFLHHVNLPRPRPRARRRPAPSSSAIAPTQARSPLRVAPGLGLAVASADSFRALQNRCAWAKRVHVLPRRIVESPSRASATGKTLAVIGTSEIQNTSALPTRSGISTRVPGGHARRQTRTRVSPRSPSSRVCRRTQDTNTPMRSAGTQGCNHRTHERMRSAAAARRRCTLTGLLGCRWKDEAAGRRWPRA